MLALRYNVVLGVIFSLILSLGQSYAANVVNLPFHYDRIGNDGGKTVKHFIRSYPQETPQSIFYEELPDPNSIKQPPDSTIPANGLLMLPFPGDFEDDIPAVNAFEEAPKENYKGHFNTLDAISGYEAISSLLPRKWDAQRKNDVTDPYFTPVGQWGHVVPQIMPFRRKLQRKGISFAAVYKGEVLGNVHGGMRKGADYTHKIDFTINIDLGRLVGMRNWSIHATFMSRAGRQTSRDYVGEYNIALQETFGSVGHRAFEVEDLYAEKKFFENQVDVAFGRMVLTHNFAVSPLLCTFQTTCSAPVAFKNNTSSFVRTEGSWGARVTLKPTRDTLIKLGFFQSFPSHDDPDGWMWGAEKTTGVALPIEFSWQPFLTRNRLPGHYKLGFMHNTSSDPDSFATTNGLRSLARHSRHYANPTSTGHMDTFWFEMDQMVYRHGGRNQMAGGYVLSGFIHNTPHVSTIDDQAYGGFTFNNPFKGRDNDRFGVLYSWYHISNRKKLGEMALMNSSGGDDLATAMVLGNAYGTFGSLGPKVKGAQTSTHIIEAYYAIAAAPGLLVQPEFLYQIRPGETRRTPDSAMAGMKVMANF